MPKPINQCDGCKRKLKLVDGRHVDEEGWTVLICTKDRYE